MTWPNDDDDEMPHNKMKKCLSRFARAKSEACTLIILSIQPSQSHEIQFTFVLDKMKIIDY